MRRWTAAIDRYPPLLMERAKRISAQLSARPAPPPRTLGDLLAPATADLSPARPGPLPL